MFYCLVFIFVNLIVLGIYMKRSPQKSALMGLLISYFCTLLLMLLFLSRQIYYYNVLTRYFYLPKSLWRYLYYLKFDMFWLMRLLNLSASSIVFSSIHFTLVITGSVKKHTRKNVHVLILIYLGITLLLHDPLIDKMLYYFWIPERISAATYLMIRSQFNTIIRSINIIIMFSGSFLMVYMLMKSPRIRMIRINLIGLTVSYFCSALTYALFLSILPAHYLTISKISDSYSYKPLILPSTPTVYVLFPFVLLLLIALITVNVYRLNLVKQKIDAKDLAIRRQIDASTITSSVLNHYVKNELVAIQAAIEEIDRKAPGLSLAEPALNRIDHLFQRLDQMQRSLHADSFELKATDLCSLVTNVVEPFRTEYASTEIILQLPKQQVFVLLDEHYFEQAVHNILCNAFDAMSIEPDQAKILSIDIQITDVWIYLSIRDTGCGMSPDQLSQIFVPYYSSQPLSRHWGIGLSHTFNIIKAHEGKIEVESELGVGTVFRILLPNIDETK